MQKEEMSCAYIFYSKKGNLLKYKRKRKLGWSTVGVFDVHIVFKNLS